jgi:hypothetical protein
MATEALPKSSAAFAIAICSFEVILPLRVMTLTLKTSSKRLSFRQPSAFTPLIWSGVSFPFFGVSPKDSKVAVFVCIM